MTTHDTLSNELAALDAMATKPTDLTMPLRLTYLGGPTYLIEIGSFRIVTDPGFDPQGTERSEGPGHILTKTMAPRVKDYSNSYKLDESLEDLPVPVVEADVRDFYRNALAVVDAGAEPVITNAQVLRTMRLLEACVQSHELREVVHFEPAASLQTA